MEEEKGVEGRLRMRDVRKGKRIRDTGEEITEEGEQMRKNRERVDEGGWRLE